MLFKKEKQKNGMRIDVRIKKKPHSIRQIIVSTETIIAFLGFTVGGVMVGRSIWEYGIEHLTLEHTLIIGLLIFITSGLILHKFRR